MQITSVKIILLFFFVGVWNQAFPQSGLSGYLVTNQDEKIIGEVISRFDQEDYDQLSFKVNGKEAKTWQPSELKEFRLDNGRYFRTLQSPTSKNLEFFQVLAGNDSQVLKRNGTFFLLNDGTLTELKELESTKMVNGQETKVVTKQYQGVLMSVLKPSPDQVKLQKMIRTAGLNDASLIRVMDQYLVDKGLESVIEPSSQKSFQSQLRVQAGVSSYGLLKSFENQGLTYSFEKGTVPYFEVGLRFKDFKSAPRLMVDLGLGYAFENDAILVEASRITFDLKGKETYSSGSFVVPIMLNYILSKGEKSALYTGVGMSFWISSYKTEDVIYEIDNGDDTPNEHNISFVNRKSMSISPGNKLGWTRSISNISNLFFELKGDLNLKDYEFTILTYYSEFHLGTLSLTGGINF